MTKTAYFELCEALGNEPIESEIPLEFEDLTEIAQQAISIYHLLRDIWEPMSGTYLGKDTTSIFDFFDLYDIEKEERRIIITLIKQLDIERDKLIQQNNKSKEPSD
jgi:hypothetical protein